MVDECRLPDERIHTAWSSHHVHFCDHHHDHDCWRKYARHHRNRDGTIAERNPKLVHRFVGRRRLPPRSHHNALLTRKRNDGLLGVWSVVVRRALGR